MKLIIVYWTDAECNEDWCEVDEGKSWAEQNMKETKTVGWIIHDCDSHISIAQTVDEEQYANIWKIPKGMVADVKVLSDDD